MQSATCSGLEQRIQRSSPGRARWSSTSRAPSSNRSGSAVAVWLLVVTTSTLLRAKGVEVSVDQLHGPPAAHGTWLERRLDGQAVDEGDEGGGRRGAIGVRTHHPG